MIPGDKISRAFYEQSYAQKGLAAQRRYPNEALVRFVSGAHFEKRNKKDLKILELGSGTGANLAMLVREGFQVYGLDFSPAAVALSREFLRPIGKAQVLAGDMLRMPFASQAFDLLCDVFSGYCFNHSEYLAFLGEVARVLKPAGLFFFYTPCTSSDAFINHAPAKKLDQYTLNGIYRTDSPYSGNHYPFHFLDAAMADEIMATAGFKRLSLERITRSYNGLAENFAHLVGIYTKEAGGD